MREMLFNKVRNQVLSLPLMAGLYIHIPFCKQACHYCDFHFSTNQANRSQLCEAIIKELTMQVSYLGGEQLETIYFGGGTPSLLLQGEIENILSAILSNYSVTENIEVTLEANPDDLTKEKLLTLKDTGINRLSIGIQSFDDEVLKFFNRAHTAKESMDCIAHAREVGFANISLDLIYAVPGQSLSTWGKNIECALAFRPEHISAYSLTIEEKTAFGKWQQQGKLKAIDENKSALDFELLMDVLSANGYEHYEISNFCRPNFYSKHNSSYWKQKKYLGVGPSAHSYDGESRQFNISNNSLYLKSLQEGQLSFERELLSRENKINEYIFTTLRTQWGCDLSYLQGDFGYSLDSTPAFKLLVDQQLLTVNGSIANLTRKGKLLADHISSELFVS
jgi:oxygen-independent coproporphyrinogen III oxidase